MRLENSIEKFFTATIKHIIYMDDTKNEGSEKATPCVQSSSGIWQKAAQSFASDIQEIKALLLKIIDAVEDSEDEDEALPDAQPVLEKQSGTHNEIRHAGPSNLDSKTVGTSGDSAGHAILGLHPGQHQCSSRFASLQQCGRGGHPRGLCRPDQRDGIGGLPDQKLDSKVGFSQQL